MLITKGEMMIRLDNSIERFIRELNRDHLLSNEYEDLYNEHLQKEKLTKKDYVATAVSFVASVLIIF